MVVVKGLRLQGARRAPDWRPATFVLERGRNELKAPSLPVEAFTVSYDLSAGNFLLDGGFGAAARLVSPVPESVDNFDPACSRRQQSLVDRRRHSKRAAKCERIYSWSHTLCNGAQGSLQRRRPSNHFENGREDAALRDGRLGRPPLGVQLAARGEDRRNTDTPHPTGMPRKPRPRHPPISSTPSSAPRSHASFQ